jgi:hypothetical protein
VIVASDDHPVGSATLPDRDELAAQARRRLGRFSWFFAGSDLLACAVLVLFTARLAGRGPDEDYRRTWVVGILVIAVMAVTFAVPVAVMRRRMRNPELLLGANRGTQSAVRRALRDGYATDARIDALARESARYQLSLLSGRRRFLPWMLAAGLLLSVAGLILGWADAGWTLPLTGQALGVAGLAAITARLFIYVPRCRRYLATSPPDATGHTQV